MEDAKDFARAFGASLAASDGDGAVRAMVQAVLDRQRYDGAFGLWSANGEPEAWLSAYAVEFLLRARAAGATVPEPALRDAIRNLAEQMDYVSDEPARKARSCKGKATGRSGARHRFSAGSKKRSAPAELSGRARRTAVLGAESRPRGRTR